MAETEFQLNPILNTVGALHVHFQRRQDVYVVGNLLLYYEEGDRTVSVAPDVFVVFGVPNHPRRTYLLWQEGKAPDFVLEVTSQSTRQVDQGRKRDVYERLGVLEYWQYDPTGDYLAPPLQGLVLSGGRYDASLALERVGDVLSAYSPVLGLNLRLDEGVLRFHDRFDGCLSPDAPGDRRPPSGSWHPPSGGSTGSPGRSPRPAGGGGDDSPNWKPACETCGSHRRDGRELGGAVCRTETIPTVSRVWRLRGWLR